ncbi:MAG: asparagine synthase B, partial [Bacteroidota bacterium]
MCGFVGLFAARNEGDALRSQVLSMSRLLRHRGPDWSGVFSCDKAILAHERLAIVDPASGGQPLYAHDRQVV